MTENIVSQLYAAVPHRGMTALAKETGIDRVHLYEIFKTGDPRLSTIERICKALGYRLRLEKL